MNTLSNQYADLIDHLRKRAADKAALERMIKTLSTDSEGCRAAAVNLGDSITLMQNFSGTLRSDVVTKFEGLLTKGIRQIFNDDAQVSIEFTNSANSVYAEFYITLQDGKKLCMASSEGGGLKDFVAVLQRILYIILEPSRPSKILFLDECFKALDSERSPKAFRFIQELCRELDIQVLFVTHAAAAKEMAGEAGVSVLEVSRVNGEAQVRITNNQ